MSVMGRFTTRSLKKNLVRTIVTVLGVALSALLVTAVLSTFVSLNRFLYDMELAESGSWEACVELADGAQAALAQEDGSLSAAGAQLAATLSDIGFCSYDDLGETGGNNDMSYLALKGFNGDVSSVLGLRCTDGRLPQSADEVLLPYNLSDENTGYDNGYRLGATVTLTFGQRQVPEGQPNAEGRLNSSQGFYVVDANGVTSANGARPEEMVSETLVDKQTRSFTVVGFYSRWNQAVVTGVGWTAFTAEPPAPGAFTEAYLEVPGAQTSAEVESAATQAFPDAEAVQLHNSLLRARGVTSQSPLWESFGAIVVILAVVVIVACISLIYNAFNISVVQRMRQFGLLASIGATKRQLRRSVALEGAIIAGIGVPLGILAGLGATAAALAWANPLFMESVVGDVGPGGNYLDGLSLGLHIDGGIIAFAAVLTVFTVFASLLVPMLRAGKASPIESIRDTRSVRIGRRGMRKAAAAARSKRAIWAPRGFAGRVMGVGGTIASLNRSREKSKGRTASAALAVAVTLMMTAGQLDVTLSTLTRTADVIPYDFMVFSYVDINRPSGNGGEQAVSDDGDAPATADDGGAADAGPSYDEVIDAYGNLYRDLSQVEAVQPRGWQVSYDTAGIVPASVTGDAVGMVKAELPDGDCMPLLTVCLMDDQLFDELCSRVGIDPQEITESETPKAIGAGTTYSRNPETGTFSEQSLFASTGAIRVLQGSSVNGAPLTSFYFDYGDDGSGEIWGCSRPDAEGNQELSPLAEADNVLADVDVVAIAGKDAFFSSSNEMTIAMPLSKGVEWGFGRSFMNSMSFSAMLDCDHDRMMDTEEDLYAATNGFSSSFVKAYPGTYVHTGVSNLYSSQVSMTNLVSIVRLFSLLFSVILVLIAMANVFNTLTNSLALRRREFAVMQSIGMGRRTFRSMIAAECVGYGAWGLVFGVLASLVVGLALNMALGSTIENAAFTVPWAYLGLSLALVVVAMGLSVAWGLHLCRSRNIVEALRME